MTLDGVVDAFDVGNEQPDDAYKREHEVMMDIVGCFYGTLWGSTTEYYSMLEVSWHRGDLNDLGSRLWAGMSLSATTTGWVVNRLGRTSNILQKTARAV